MKQWENMCSYCALRMFVNALKYVIMESLVWWTDIVCVLIYFEGIFDATLSYVNTVLCQGFLRLMRWDIEKHYMKS